MKRRLLVLIALLMVLRPAFAVGPYTAFTYGDPANLTNWPGNSIVFVVKRTLVFGMALNPPSPVPVGPTIMSGTVAIPYSETFSVGGTGVSPFTWLCTDTANLPPGLTFSTGLLSGTPTTAGSFTFHIKVTDSGGNTNTQPFTVIISAPAVGGNSGFVG